VRGHGALPEAVGRVHFEGAEGVQPVEFVFEGEGGGGGAEGDAPSAQGLQRPRVTVL
jgi:hypothetical protein